MPQDDKAQRQRKLLTRIGERNRVLIDEGPIPHPDQWPARAPTYVTRQEDKFIRYWVASYADATSAARRAGYAGPMAKKMAYKLLADPRIQNRIAEIEREMMGNTHIDAENLFREIVTQNLRLARAKVPVEVWNPPCRHCHGTNHEYQRTHGEFEADFENHVTKQMRPPTRLNPHPRVPLFDPKGGPGYDPSLPPHPDCPNCHGAGDIQHPIVRIKDTRFLTPEERELFQGAKATKAGIETLWKDQAQARAFLNDLALRMADTRRPEDAIDITDMSVTQLRQFLQFAQQQGFDVDLESLDAADSDDS